ncbi:uncharacterized mitochondrial protein AtMg00810-like [Capsicum annuum]|uniref:uncharacterized mitochondrial protein AtMg00810-like n=1 Tax=Capsicum annuum TaxID=4072 RepID=UPI001FB0F7D3|nr:uncharacterized mitochondrial protein AtMg00810-like [Capsicum annuum]
MIITGDNKLEISNLRKDLSVRFEMKILGQIGYFLGLEVEKSDRGYFVSHKSCAESLLECFIIRESKEKATPMELNLKLKKDEGEALKDVIKFRQLVGSLIYLTITRPTISYFVGVVSQFMQNPTTSHLNVAKRILRYVKGSLSHGLWYKRCDTFLLSGFTDANCAGDTHDRRSTLGYCFSTGSTVVSWCSNVQIKCDNESAIKLVSNPVFHARTKHVEIRHHFVHEKVLSEEIELTTVRTNSQVVDIFTKALEKSKFQYFRDALGVVHCELALRGSVTN